MQVKRIGMVIEVKADRLAEYKALHADSHPGVRDLLSAAHIQNFSIYVNRFPDGKLYLFGVQELYRLAHHDSAPRLDRLLHQLLGDAAVTMFPDDATPAVSYPPMPCTGSRNLVIAPVEDDTAPPLQIDGEPVHTTRKTGHLRTAIAPQNPGNITVSVGDRKTVLTAVSNPGMEDVAYEFNEPFLQQLAEQTNGRYLHMTAAAETLKNMRPETWNSSTADRLPLARHWTLLVAVAVMGTLHWLFRKLAGLAI